MRAFSCICLVAWQVSLCLAGGSLVNELRKVIKTILGKDIDWSPGNTNYVCAAIDACVPGVVFYPLSPQYASSLQNYYAEQNSELKPGCFVRPKTTADVSKVVKILSAAYRVNNTNQFAFKSGGHATAIGIANINGGVTIDLGSLSSVTISDDRKTAFIQPGATWGEAYNALESYGVAVSGGRVAGVGVGGLALGGGISFFAPKYGWACDNIEEYEVVIADGSIVRANQQQNHDLWLALKGGSNNFGIVTQFAATTFPQGKLWGGSQISLADTAPQQLQALTDFAGPGYDESTSVIQTHTFTNPLGVAANVVVNNLQQTDGIPNPPKLTPFTDIPHISSTVRTDSLYNMAVELGAGTPDGMRQFEMTLTYENDLALHNKSYALFDASKEKVKDVSNILWLLIFEPLPTAITSKAAARGGNVLGLENNDKQLMLVLIQAIWTDAKDDDTVISTLKGLYNDVSSAAKSANKLVPYQYLNYADSSQDPLGSYGAENKKFLQDVSRKYDGEGFFQDASPGGFKLFR